MGLLLSLFGTVTRVLIFIAILPAVLLLVYIYKKDRLEKEPVMNLVRLMGAGCLSTLFALIAELIGGRIIEIFTTEGTILYNALEYFLVVGFAEEGFKYLLLRKKTWYNKNFNCSFDGIVYAVSVSLGFALLENIEYVLMYGFSTGIVRAVTAVPGHACFAVLMGYFYSRAKECDYKGDKEGAKKNKLLAIIVPVLAHGAYDFLTTLNEWIFIIFLIAMFVFVYRLIKKESANDHYINRKPETQNDVFDELFK